jgi:hypothetical protein
MFKMKILYIDIFYIYIDQKLLKLCLTEINDLNKNIDRNRYTYEIVLWTLNNF